MDAIQVTARLTIHEGKLEQFKELAAQCMRSARERDSGTLQYDWFFNDSYTECVVRETYKDSWSGVGAHRKSRRNPGRDPRRV